MTDTQRQLLARYILQKQAQERRLARNKTRHLNPDSLRQPAWRKEQLLTLIYGHRGAKGEAPENTLTSFQECLEHGVRRCELDLHLSNGRRADGHPRPDPQAHH